MKKITPITPEEIQNILKEVNYPGFSRDIVSFGMVKDISIQDAQINILLQINSDNKNTLKQLHTTIQEKLKEYDELDIQINIQKSENHPVQLQIKDSNIPINYTLEKFDDPAQR